MSKRAKDWAMALLLIQMVFLFGVPSGRFAAQAETASQASVAYYVSPDGNDANPGTLAAPFATLERARDAVRQLKGASGLPAGGVTVFLRGGVYSRTDSLFLDAGDSGTSGSPVVYRSYEGEEAHIVGGAALAPEAFHPVTDSSILSRLPIEAQGQVVEIDLHAQGITDFGQIKQYGFGLPVIPPSPELFIDGKEMELGRYPNEGYDNISYVVDTGSIPRDGDLSGEPPIFEYEGDRPERWSQANDIWMFGYWAWDWADGNLQIGSIDTANKRITAVQPSFYGIRLGQRYYYYNLLEEVDRPGEWYLDRASGKLYLYPPSTLAGSDIKLSLLEKPLVKLTDASYVEFRRLTFEASRGSAIEMSGGAGNLVEGSRFADLGMYAVKVNGGSTHGVVGNEIVDTGMGGIVLSGGDRTTLTPAGHYAENNHIARFARIKKTYSAAVELAGVGNRAAHNLIHDAPHLAVLIHGNDHLIENNEIYDVLKETGDSGAIYMGRDWTEQGNVIRNNLLHDIGNAVGEGGQIGIYLDDMASGTTAYGNIFDRVNRAFLVGGGRDNRIENNFVIASGRSVDLDERGMNASAATCSEGGELRTALGKVPYQSEPWRSRYPSLVTILDDLPCVPKYNVLQKNVLYDTPDMTIAPSAVEYGTIESNWHQDAGTADTLFMDLAAGDYRVKYDSQPQALEVSSIDQEAIGLRSDFGFAVPDEELTRLFVKTDRSDSGQSIVALKSGETATLQVTARTTTGFFADLSTAAISYASDNAAVATVDGQGVITPQGDGVAQVTTSVYKDGSAKTISLYVFVGNDVLNKIKMSADRTALQLGESMPLTLEWITLFGERLDLAAETAYVSSDPNVAVVDGQGNVTAVGVGHASITATTVHDGISKTATIEIDVYERLLQSISLTLASNILQTGEPASMSLLAAMTDGQTVTPTAGQIEYVVESPDVIQPDAQGRLVALRQGRSAVEVRVSINGLTMSRIVAFAVYDQTVTNVPAPWSVYTTPGKNGFATYADGRFFVASNTDNIWNSADDFTFVYQPVHWQDDQTLTLQTGIDSLYNTSKDAAAGIMLRESLAPGARHVSLRMTPSGSLLFIYRPTENGPTSFKAAGKGTFPGEIKLVREGDAFIGYVKAFGRWQEAASITLDLSDDLLAGTTLFSHTWNQAYNQVTDAGFTDTTVQLQPLQLSKISVTTPTNNLIASQSVTLQVYGYMGTRETPVDLTGAISFASSNPAIVTVDAGGVVTAVADGTASVTVTVTKDGVTLQEAVPFTVTRLALEELDVSATDASLQLGETGAITAFGRMNNGTRMNLKDVAGVTLTYASSNEAVATVDPDGVITTGQPGISVVTITAQLDGVTSTKKIVVVVYTQTKFAEDFETGYDGWTVEGSPPSISSALTRNGAGSLKLDQDKTTVTRSLSTVLKGVTELWFYDDGQPNKAGVAVINNLMVGPYYSISQTHYAVRYGSEMRATVVLRSVGWHQLIVDYESTANQQQIYIDGELVDVRDGTGLKTIIVSDYWVDGKLSNVQYDDIGIYGIS